MLGLDTAYVCTKCDNSSYSRSIGTVGAHQNMVNVTWPRPFQGYFVIRRLGLATINIPIKFERCTSTHYEDMKGTTKY